jgi:tetratricopeptide (TPR) repeat protein
MLRVSESASADNVEDAHAAVVACERAALNMAQFDYTGSRDLAAKARRLVLELGGYRSWLAYCRALLAMAQIRLHEPALAEQAFEKALDAVPKDPARLPLFAPRILYTAALIASHHGNHALARQYCERALDALQRARISSRDVSLGLLTLAEVQLMAGEAAAAREAVTKSLDTTRRLFGSKHQDAVGGLELLAQIAAREGKPAEARERADEAVKLAVALFGEDAPGVRVVRHTVEEVASGSGGR